MPVLQVPAAAVTAALPENKMRFSIIIPTFNEASNIVSCINSISDNLGDGIKKDDMEIIIVDRGRTAR